MADSSYLQSSFLGGQWSSYYQGRFTDPKYREAMAICLNAIPLEEGSVTRRPGSRYIAATKAGQPAVLWPFGFTASAPYNMEFTAGFLRLVYGPALVLEPTTQSVVSLSADTPCIVTTSSTLPTDWATGDEVQFFLPVGDITDFGTALLLNRQFVINVTSAETFTIADSITSDPVDGALLSLGTPGMLVSKVLRFSVPYQEADLPQIRIVQAINNETNQVLILHPKYQPQVLTAISNPDAAFNTYATFKLAPAIFLDGPYLDPPADGANLTPSALTGVVDLTVGFDAWSSIVTYGIGDTVSYGGVGYISLIDSNLNNEPDISSEAWQPEAIGADVSMVGFQSTDVGRSIRLFSEPLNWNSTTAYAANATVKFDGSYWSALVANTAKQPGLDVVNWAVDASAAVWTWGRIQSVISPTEVSLQLLGGNLLYLDPINTWQMGRYSDTTGWPTNGTYDDAGRLWLVGLQGNHFDASMTNQTLTFSPTGSDDTVADNNAIAETLNDKEVDPIFWMLLSHGGIVCGTQGGEWLIQASALNDPLTPTNIQAHKVTKYGQENIQPVHAPLAFLTVQRYARKCLEYISDVYSGKYSATNISIAAADLIQNGGGIAQVAYQQERTPILWARLNNGKLIGMTYKRDSPFGTQPAQFSAWHQHTLGSNRNVISISGGAAAGGETDTLTMVTQDPVTGLCWLELLTDIFDEDQDITDAWFVDGGDLPFLVQLDPSGLSGVRLYGYYYLAGQSVAVWATGIDMGDLTVSATGSIDVPFGSDPKGLFTLARMEALTADYMSLFPDKASFVSSGNSTPVPGPPNTAGIRGFVDQIYGGGVSYFNWASGYFTTSGNNIGNTDGGFTQFSLETAALVNAVDKATMTTNFGPGLIPIQTLGNINATGSVGADGIIYYCDDDNRVIAIGPNLNIVGIYGYAGSATISAPGATQSPFSSSCVSAGHQFYIQSGQDNIGDHAQEMLVLDASLIRGQQASAPYINKVNVGNAYGSAPICGGKSISDGVGHYYGEAWGAYNYAAGIEASPISTSITYTAPHLIEKAAITCSPPTAATATFSSPFSISPSQIDPTWAWFAGQCFMAYDATDGNLLFAAHTTVPQAWVSGAFEYPEYGVVLGSNGHAYGCIANGGVAGTTDPTTDAGVHWQDLGAPAFTHDTYLCKINSVTGDVLWALPIHAQTLPSLGGWENSLIENGYVALMDYEGGVDSNVLWIDTLTGAVAQTFPVTGCTLSAQVWGPQGLFIITDYTPGGGAPVPVLPATEGFQCWGQFEAIPVVPTQLVIPVVAGYPYPTQVQILKPIAPQEAGAQNGPALGKTRRAHMAAYYFHGAQGVSFGTDFAASLHACNFMLNASSVTPLPITSLYNDIYWDSIEDDYSFNSQPAWTVTRPYPATCLAIEAMLHTQDR